MIATTPMPVEAPGGLWHLRQGERTLCGVIAEDWPLVFNWAERCGIWCGVCLHESGATAT